MRFRLRALDSVLADTVLVAEKSASIFVVLLASALGTICVGCGGTGTSLGTPPSNPQPSIANVSPSMTIAGSDPQVVTINGSNFLLSSTVTFAGVAQKATFVNSGQLTIQVSSAEQATAGIYSIVVVNPGPGGGRSSPSTFTVNNPQPVVSSITPSVLATKSPDTKIALTGSGFIAGSSVTVNGTTLKTDFISTTQLNAVIPAAKLTNTGSLEVTATNSPPKGGSSGAVSIEVVTVSSFAILAVPAETKSPANSWIVAAAAIDGQGFPIAGLLVTLSASSGNLSASQGLTSTSGALTAQLSSPAGSTSPQAVSVSAVTGSQTAVAALTLGGTATLPTNIKHEPSSIAIADDTIPDDTIPSTAANVLASVGVSGPPGLVNPFLSQPNCVTADALSTVPTSQCVSSLSGNNIAVKPSTFVNMACNTLTAFNNISGIVQCAGFSVSVISCALSETGVGAVLCGAALTTGFEVTLGLASGCLQYLAGLAAEQFHLNLLTTAIDEFGIVTDATNPLGYASLICDSLPQSLPIATAGPSTQLVCPPGGTCLVVVNFASNSVTIYDVDGNQLGTPVGAFPGLAGPDGIVFDPNNGYFYVGNISSDSIAVYDLYGNPVPTKFVGLTVPGIEDVSFDPLRRRILANSPSQNQISIFEEDGTPITLAGGFANLNQPYGVGVNPQNGVLYVSNSGNTASLYDSAGKEVVLPSGAFSGLTSPDDVTFDPATGDIFIAQAADNVGAPCAFSGIAVFDQNGNALDAPGGFPNISCPDQIVTNGNGVALRLYVTNITGNSIRIYDKAGNDLTPQNVFLNLNQPTGVALVQMAH